MGSQSYTSPGDASFTVPDGVTSIDQDFCYLQGKGGAGGDGAITPGGGGAGGAAGGGIGSGAGGAGGTSGNSGTTGADIGGGGGGDGLVGAAPGAGGAASIFVQWNNGHLTVTAQPVNTVQNVAIPTITVE